MDAHNCPLANILCNSIWECFVGWRNTIIFFSFPTSCLEEKSDLPLTASTGQKHNKQKDISTRCSIVKVQWLSPSVKSWYGKQDALGEFCGAFLEDKCWSSEPLLKRETGMLWLWLTSPAFHSYISNNILHSSFKLGITIKQSSLPQNACNDNGSCSKNIH